MTLPTLDPHPHGCPLGIAATPEEMTDVVRGVCHKLRDLVSPVLHVIDPSKGERYPILSLYTAEGDERARVVLFPGWETNRHSSRWRLGFGRQAALLERISRSGVSGEKMHAEPQSEPDVDGPLVLSLACTAAEVESRVHDLYTYLGDRIRITVAAHESSALGTPLPTVPVVRLYSPFDASSPRVVLIPAWTGRIERRRDLFLGAERERLLELPGDEVEAEDFIGVL